MILINRKTESTVEQQLLRTVTVQKIQRNYYPDRNTNMKHYIPYPDGVYTQEELPEVEESYSMTYRTSTSTNGHGDNESPDCQNVGKNAHLISRTTSQTKTQQVKTVTKVVSTRKVQHIGPDGQPMEYSPYDNAPVNSEEYENYPYSTSDIPSNYDTYDSGRPPSPAGQVPPQNYHPDYGNYGRISSPPVEKNCEMYHSQSGQNYAEYGYQRCPPPSLEHGSAHRAMPQVPRIGIDYTQHPCSYEELDSLSPNAADYQGRYKNDQFGYNPYETSPLPQSYLDHRPSYDDHPSNHHPNTHPAATYASPSKEFEGEMLPCDGHINQPHNTTIDENGREMMWRYPDLHEVIEFLNHPNNVIRANAAAYLQHLCYMNDSTKQKTRALGGIPPLIDLLNQDIPEIQKNACGALRNLSFGRQNDENKRAICNSGGIPALIHLLRKTPDSEIRDLVTGVLWNLSSSEDLKRIIIDDCLHVLVNHIIIPHSGWDKNEDQNRMKSHEIHWSTVFRNASGVIRNVSSAGEYARQRLRACEGLVDALLHLVGSAIGKNDIDNKCVENCVCILRNLSYRCQEVEDPEYEKHHLTSLHSSLPIKSVGDNLGCFGANKKKKEIANVDKRKTNSRNATNLSPTSEPVRGMERLWQPEVVQIYLALLSDCSNQATLEAAAGSIQNLAACYWQPSIDIRATVRKEKGLPILIELLKMDEDRVVCAVATALRNLAMDQRNKELIGKHAMRDLIQKLPSSASQQIASDDTIAAILATLNEVIVRNSDFAYTLLEAGGVERLMYIMNQKGRFSSRIIKFTSESLYNLWQHQELREAYRKVGWRECHFINKTSLSRNASSPMNSFNSSLSCPVSSQSGTKYEDKTLPRGQELNSISPGIRIFIIIFLVYKFIYTIQFQKQLNFVRDFTSYHYNLTPNDFKFCTVI
ncbi:catenin delta-2-like isoform X2 [Centruroides sculpturatus]|uniref:catenin delta-2-like isoform X2 n=1 Tax=Centruroides sculpturatus TaxID=218467 RepID=UPI000C6E5721|nr:catenin delta-2-like isoform X2 [Centruroides sculpturatus]